MPLPHLYTLWIVGDCNKQTLLLFQLPGIIIPCPSDGLQPTVQHVDEWRSSDCLMAIRLCIFTAHESRRAGNPQQHILILFHFFPLHTLFYTFSVIQPHFFSFSCLSLSLLPPFLSLSGFPRASVPLYAFPAAKLKHVLLILLYLCPSFFPVHMTATLSVNCFAVIPF